MARPERRLISSKVFRYSIIMHRVLSITTSWYTAYAYSYTHALCVPRLSPRPAKIYPPYD